MKAPIRFRQPGRAATVLGIVLAAACGGSTNLAEHATIGLRIDLSPLEERTIGSRQESGVSVVESVSLIVDPADGAPQERVAEVAAGESDVRFQVTVPIGVVSLQASVFSNDGTEIYSGETVEEITGDTTVVLDVEAVDAVLAIFPDSLELGPANTDPCFQFEDPCGEVMVMNPGSRELTWRFEGTSPEVLACEEAPSECFMPADSILSPGGTQPVAFALFGASPGLVTVRFGSQVGHVDVKVLVP